MFKLKGQRPSSKRVGGEAAPRRYSPSFGGQRPCRARRDWLMGRKLCCLHSPATVVSARELHHPSVVEAERNITSQWQVPQI